jgi:hypothetical protein
MFETWFGADDRWPMAVVVTALGIIALAALRWQRRRRAAAYLAALTESVAGKVTPTRGPNAHGFVAQTQPAPPPFVRFTVEYRRAGGLGRREGILVIWADLAHPPRTEMVWRRGMLPAQALGGKPGAGAWRPDRLDFANVEFAARGADTLALRHVFADLQKRYGPMVDAVIVRGDAEAHVEMRVRTRQLERRDLPALVALAQAIGRAARGV